MLAYRMILVWLLRILGGGTLLYLLSNLAMRLVGVFDGHGDSLRELARLWVLGGAFAFSLIMLAAAEMLAIQVKTAR